MSSSTAPEIISGTDRAAVEAICKTHSLTEPEFRDLQRQAIAAKANAHCPYSKFHVGASLLCASGAVVTGANVENASYPVGTCAERVALATAVTGGHGKKGFRALAVATDISPPASPCGMCRQFIREFFDMQTPVIMFDKNEDFIVMTLDQLLPMSFGPDRLPPPA